MYKKMLVLLDGSKLAEIVFIYAQELSGRLNLDLDLLSVVGPEEVDQLPMRQAYIEHMAEALQKQCETVRAAVCKPGEKPVVARGKVVVGYPADEILKYASENSADIIMLSSHGRSGIRRWGLGSVADKVIRATSVPVWLVPSQIPQEVIYDKLPKRTILVPLDGSKSAEVIIPHIIALAKQRGAESEMILVNVYKPVTLLDIPWGEPDEIRDRDSYVVKVASQRYLAGMVKQFEAEGLKVRAVQLSGDPAEEIIKYIKGNTPSLIAMAIRPHSGFSEFALGHVPEHLLFNLQSPIFMVRPREPVS